MNMTPGPARKITRDVVLELVDAVRCGAQLRGLDGDAAACASISTFITAEHVERIELEREVEHLRRELGQLRRQIEQCPNHRRA